jgi:hypothetical protein
MMQSRLSGSPCYYINLQIIHRTPQVKTQELAGCALGRVSLGFKQLAQGLHANWMSFGRHLHVMAPAAWKCRGVACGDSGHENKLATCKPKLWADADFGCAAVDQGEKP